MSERSGDPDERRGWMLDSGFWMFDTGCSMLMLMQKEGKIKGIKATKYLKIIVNGFQLSPAKAGGNSMKYY
jgi:hypothetical protein